MSRISADNIKLRCLEVALIESFIFSAISPTEASYFFFNRLMMARRLLFAKAFNTLSNSLSFISLFYHSSELENMGHGENLTGLSSGKFHVESGALVGARRFGPIPCFCAGPKSKVFTAVQITSNTIYKTKQVSIIRYWRRPATKNGLLAVRMDIFSCPNPSTRSSSNISQVDPMTC